MATLGLARDGEIFGWDNEYVRHAVHVPAFEIDQYEVTNGQYLDFIAAGGYGTRDFWSDAGLGLEGGARDFAIPCSGSRQERAWLYRGMFEEVPLPLDWPVYVSHAEAVAYARWAGKSLPTEAEWHRAAYGTRAVVRGASPGAMSCPIRMSAISISIGGIPAPVNAFPAGASAFGVHDLLGNGWEWTSTEFAPFDRVRGLSVLSGLLGGFF